MSDAKKLPDFIFKSGIGPESMNEELFIGRFMEEMRSGLRGESGSLGMIPTYISCSADLPESGFAVAIDAGGTNFRTALVRFEGGKVSLDKFDTVPMPGTQGAVTWAEFIRFAADSIRPYMSLTRKIAVCISFPTEITPERDGIIIHTTKEVNILGYEGRHICRDLLEELDCAGASAVVVNDTTAVLLSGLVSGADGAGLIGLINGTGTNVCCQADVGGRKMIVDVESGGFIPPQRSEIDAALDAATAAPGVYMEEKLVSGAYLGEICRRAFRAAAEDGIFTEHGALAALGLERLPTPAADAFIDGAALECFEADADADAARQIAKAVFSRAAKHIACTLSAVMRFCGTDGGAITVSADGSVFRKSRYFRSELERYVGLLEPGRRVNYVSVDNSTALGTAVAAVME